jgi:hypothetical protein
MSWPARPVIYEINTWPWLNAIGASLGEVADSVWDSVCRSGVDAVWLMGVWTRSPAGRAVSLADDGNVASFRDALVDYSDDDDVGSAYCVRDYAVDPRLGGADGLRAARASLAARGVRLMLDFVPNHIAIDHPWCDEHPEYLVRGTPEEQSRDPASFVTAGDHVYANGRDPYFPAWRDVVQLNGFATSLRRAAAATLDSIARQCDGVRCDMAMLLLNKVFAQTWGTRVGLPPPTEYWNDVIGATRATHPGFVFMAEAYWDLEWDLQQLGFDFCYDKRLYDRLIHEDAASIRGHLDADLGYQSRLVRFIENHDEPRAAAAFSPERERAAAVVVATTPGATLWFDGQFEGRRIHLPVFLRRFPVETFDDQLRSFYERVLGLDARHGEWQLCACEGWPDNDSAQRLLAWTWTDGPRRSIVVVNASEQPAQGRVRLPWTDLGGMTVTFTDALSGDSYERSGDELRDQGLYVDRPPWGAHVLRAG